MIFNAEVGSLLGLRIRRTAGLHFCHTNNVALQSACCSLQEDQTNELAWSPFAFVLLEPSSQCLQGMPSKPLANSLSLSSRAARNSRKNQRGMDPKALLDELMGKDRDLPLDQQKKKRLQFDDPEVCHYHLVAFCPHDLFPNTKSDLGACNKLHDDSLRADFQNSNTVTHYEAEFLGYLERLISDLERKIKRCHERLDKEMPLTDHARANSDRISAIAMEVQSLLKQAEKEGEDGQVDQAQATMSLVEVLNKDKDQLVRAVMPEFGSILEKEKRMQVCEVCGAMQASTDTEKRLASHLEGKQHLGYFRIRRTATELRKKKEERESRKRDRETLENTLENDGKFKLEVVVMEDFKDTDKNVSRPDERERCRRERSRSQEKYRRRSRNPERGWDREFDRGIKDCEKNKYLDRDRNRDHYSSRSRDHERDRDGLRDNERGNGRDHERNRERVGRRQSHGRDHR